MPRASQINALSERLGLNVAEDVTHEVVVAKVSIDESYCTCAFLKLR